MEEFNRSDPTNRDKLKPVHELHEALAMLREELNLLEAIPGLPDASRGALHRARHLHGRASAMVQEVGELTLPPLSPRHRIDMQTLLHSLADLLAAWLKPPTRSALELQVTGSGAWVEGDPVQLTQGLLILVSSAMNVTGEGGHVGIETSQDDRYLRIVCQSASRWVHRSRSDLIQAQAIFLAHGGWIDWEGESEPSTRIVVSLPLVSCPQHETPQPRVRSANVLIIDHEVDICRLCRLILEQNGMRVWVRRSLEEADHAPVPEALDLMVIDSERCSGMYSSWLERLLSKHPTARLIFTSTGLLQPLPEMVQQRQAIVLTKPFTPPVLLQQVTRLLGVGQNTEATPQPAQQQEQP